MREEDILLPALARFTETTGLQASFFDGRGYRAATAHLCRADRQF